jgi:hypothetical protein
MKHPPAFIEEEESESERWRTVKDTPRKRRAGWRRRSEMHCT